jgi:hypothetical protein
MAFLRRNGASACDPPDLPSGYEHLSDITQRIFKIWMKVERNSKTMGSGVELSIRNVIAFPGIRENGLLVDLKVFSDNHLLFVDSQQKKMAME